MCIEYFEKQIIAELNDASLHATELFFKKVAYTAFMGCGYYDAAFMKTMNFLKKTYPDVDMSKLHCESQESYPGSDFWWWDDMKENNENNIKRNELHW